MKTILALDQGTTSCRAILFDENGRIVAKAQREIAQIYPQPGWVEHDAMEIWHTQLALATEVCNGQQIAAIGITNQRETTLLWNRTTGLPIADAIVWQDRRTSEDCEQLRQAGLANLVTQKTGLLIDPYFCATKIRWLLNNVPGARQLALSGKLAFGTMDCWLLWNLTGGQVHATDITNASRTLLFNIHSQKWDSELLTLFDIPASLLPTVVDSSGFIAETRCATIGNAIPVSGMAGDQHAALFGQACHQPGMAKNTYGTGCFMLMNTGKKPVASQHHLLTTLAWRINQQSRYALEGSVFAAGAAIQWLRDGLGIIRQANDVEALAQSVGDTDGVYLVPAFAGLGAPHWDADARGIISGLSRGSNQGHIARAALECIAYQSAELLLAMQADSAIEVSEMRVDGGAAVNNFLLQFQADLLGVPVLRSAIQETTAWGVALLAGLAVGFWKSEEETAELWKPDRIFMPTMPQDRVMQKMNGWRDAVARCRS